MSSLRIFNTLGRSIETFVPAQPGHVRMYLCGMTVYDYCHVGHARVMLIFDMVHRWLLASGYQVTLVRNITDIDDKIIQRAVHNGESIYALTARTIAAMHEDSAALGILAPTHEPRATDHVPQMLDMITRLSERGLAYQHRTKGQVHDVNFAVRKFKGYGKLSGKSLDSLRAGERVAIGEGKDDPLDFALWKIGKESDPQEVRWDSAFGIGRPGWHIECSAMCWAILGETIDIHGGGADLQFPHHENEIAQSEGAHGKPLARYWMHGGFLNVDNEKMSKSLGNFSTIRDVLQHYDAQTLRFFMLRTHYRGDLNYSDQHVDAARAALRRLYTTLQNVPPASTGSGIDWSQPYAARFQAAMNEDFATPEATAVLFELATEVNRSRDALLSRMLRDLGGVLGLLQQNPTDYLQQAAGTQDHQFLDTAAIEAAIAARLAARLAKDFAQSDAIRAALIEQGVVLKDGPGGTTWERA